MYTGITCGLYEVVQVEKKPGLVTYTVRFNADLVANLKIGASRRSLPNSGLYY